MTTHFPKEVTKKNNLDFPEFLEKKLQACDDELFKPRKNGKPLVIGSVTPGAGSIMLQSNDYLNIAAHPFIRDAQLKVLQQAGNEPVMSAVFLHEGSEKYFFEQLYCFRRMAVLAERDLGETR